MIGVAVPSEELDTVREFFELFKTPWEPAAVGRRYSVVLSTVGPPDGLIYDQLIAYGASAPSLDGAAAVSVKVEAGVTSFEWAGFTVPVYCGAAVFAGGGEYLLRSARGPVDYRTRHNGAWLWRVGYDLFREVRHLLAIGQPSSNALVPTLDRHIAVLRNLLTRCGIVFVEVEPRPAGYPFLCCLTHDIDFFGIRRHAFDRTLAGFVVRASVGSLKDAMTGRRPWADAGRNWLALASLPLVMLGALPDLWQPIDDYERADGSRTSTFFVIPYKRIAGDAPAGPQVAARAVKYQASDVADSLRMASKRGRELAVHGIDAWRDERAGMAEMDQIASLADRRTTGVRMHWLYFFDDSPARLEAAGFDYDSTLGYNDAVGYRAGTAQVFKLSGTRDLMELPLSIMDTALFYRDRLGLAHTEALELCRAILAYADSAGGTVVVNWHDRSLALERLWHRAYAHLLQELDSRKPWYATASEAVRWFRWRRSVRFESTSDGTVVVRGGPGSPSLPAARVTVHRPAPSASYELSLAGDEVLRIMT